MPERDDSQDYSPEAVEFWLKRWSMLVAATQGGTNSGNGAGRGDRMSLACLKADLEHAADTLPTYWQSTEWVFKRQHRAKWLYARRQTTIAPDIALREYESSIPSEALETAFYRMSLSLGWVP